MTLVLSRLKTGYNESSSNKKTGSIVIEQKINSMLPNRLVFEMWVFSNVFRIFYNQASLRALWYTVI